MDTDKALKILDKFDELMEICDCPRMNDIIRKHGSSIPQEMLDNVRQEVASVLEASMQQYTTKLNEAVEKAKCQKS